MKKQFEKLQEFLKQDKKIALAVIVKKHGSSPRSEGAYMLIDENSSYGTISGGKEEFRIIKDARKLLIENESRLNYYSIDNKKAGDLGMICGGENYVYIRIFDKNDLEIVEKFNEQRNVDKDISIIYDTKTHDLILSTETSKFENLKKNTFIEERYFIHNIQTSSKVLIFGAGHVSKALAHLTNFCGFDTIVMDDRDEFLDKSRFDDEVILKKVDFLKLDVDISDNDFCLLVTRGHKFDDICAKYILENSNVKYIGCMGSKRKATTMKENLLNEGYDLSNLYVPVGIEISSETPEEIAVSVLAQMIKLKNERQENDSRK
ncbi:MAG: XdhC family protein [Tissierellia bacterium]|nr:XdhC family protein [Tissierellia bacterium]